MLLSLTCLFYVSVNSSQIFVATEENVKFEVSGVSAGQPTTDPLGPTQTNQQTQQQQQQQQKPCKL